MMHTRTNRAGVLGSVAGVVALVLAGCGNGEDSGDGSVTLTYLITNLEQVITENEALVDAFEAQNPHIQIEIETRPGGTEGDNLIKTRLQTGEMTDIFYYNAGSLFQALAPQQSMVPLSGGFVDNILDVFKAGVSVDDTVYGVPVGGSMGGGILYHKPTYAELGLEIPTTWDEFMANNQVIAEAGEAAPVIQTYGDTWTSQLFVLGDFYNVLAEEPGFADAYTANQAHFADTPAALRGFQHLQEVYEAGYLNEDFAAALYTDGLAMLANGEGVHYPMLTFAAPELAASHPEQVDDVGFFAMPGEDPANSGVTTWLPVGTYIAQTTDHPEEAMAFLEFIASVEGCDVSAEAVSPTGPYLIEGCELPDDVPAAVADMLPYFESGQTEPALEFLSPVKGPSLENITVEVGSGIRSATDGAALYDEDVKKQAQQLGLDGW
jgi:raffinose/stachyose/melibiose transport system substrate-binding protein